MGRVFILGAGASCFAGYPLALDLWAFVRDHSGHHAMAISRREEVIRLVEEALIALPPDEHERPDLEQLLTLFDLAAQGVAPLHFRRADWKMLRRQLIGMISEAFLHRHHELQRTKDPKVQKVLSAWTTYLSDDDTIITFNWDILHEAALWSVGKWDPSKGYAFLPSNIPDTSVHSTVKLLKLHGSANWEQQHEQDTVPNLGMLEAFFPGASRRSSTLPKGSGWNEGRYLITPTYLKDISTNPLLLQLWHDAKTAIASASSVTAIGYRAHPADALARYLLASSLLLNTELSSIQVIDPSDTNDQWDKMCVAIGKRRTRIRKTFEEWITATA